MKKFKDFWFWLIAGLGGLCAFLWYFLSRKNLEVNSLKTKINFIETQKQADLLEVEIRHRQQEKSNSEKERLELQRALEDLKLKRLDIKQQAEKLKNPKDVADYWENN